MRSWMKTILFTCDEQLAQHIWSPGAAVFFLQQGLTAWDNSCNWGGRTGGKGWSTPASAPLDLQSPAEALLCWPCNSPEVLESVTKVMLGEIWKVGDFFS